MMGQVVTTGLEFIPFFPDFSFTFDFSLPGISSSLFLLVKCYFKSGAYIITIIIMSLLYNPKALCIHLHKNTSQTITATVCLVCPFHFK